MPVKATPRFFILLLSCATILGVVFVTSFRNTTVGTRHLYPGGVNTLNAYTAPNKGASVMPKLGNETAKAELGRATWKYFHTVMARFPEQPTVEERTTLSSYIHLFQRLYPCGECADHFGEIIERFPPQVSSRSAAATWACHVHNEVNKSLKKAEFDCTQIGDFYDCGCADDEKEEAKAKNTAIE